MLHSYKEGFKIGFKKARKEAGYTQQSFVESFGSITIDTIRNWEQGRSIPEFSTIELLCNFFKCDLDYLFGNIEYKTHDHKYICETTGLTEKAVEVLEKLQVDCAGEKLNYGAYSFGGGCKYKFPGGQKMLRVINEVLEVEYDHMKEEPNGYYIGNLLKSIDDYMHPFDFNFGIYDKSKEVFTFGGHKPIIRDNSQQTVLLLEEDEIYRNILLNRITKMIMNRSYYLPKDDGDN